MDFLLALRIPGMTGTIAPPANVPTGGLFSTGQDAIRAGITFFLIIVVLLAIFYLLIGALRYVYSRGDKQKIEGAREKITFSIVGLIIAFLAFVLMTIISQFFNVPLLSPFTVSVSHSCGACTNIDPVTVTTRAIDIESGLKIVFVVVDKGSGFESHNCSSSPCVWNIGPLPPGTYKYYGTARNNDGKEKTTGQPKTFTIVAATCNLLTSCPNCLTKVGCMWARDLRPGSPLACHTFTNDPDACLEDYSEIYRAGCTQNECAPPPSCSGTCRNDEAGCNAGETPVNNTTCSLGGEICCVVTPLSVCTGICRNDEVGCNDPVETVVNNTTCSLGGEICCVTGATPTPSPTSAPTPTGTIVQTPTPSVCQNVCTTNPCTRSGGLPGVILNIFFMNPTGCQQVSTACVDNNECPFPTSTPAPTSTIPPATPTPAVASCLNNPVGCTFGLRCGNLEKCDCFEECLSGSCDISSDVCKIPPDLWIWALLPSSFSPSSGENLIITASVVNANIGVSASDFSTAPNSVVRFYEGSEPGCNDPGWFAEAQIKSLAPFVIDTKLIIIPAGTFAPGLHYIWALADGACSFIESNEINNATFIIINVR